MRSKDAAASSRAVQRPDRTPSAISLADSCVKTSSFIALILIPARFQAVPDFNESLPPIGARPLAFDCRLLQAPVFNRCSLLGDIGLYVALAYMRRSLLARVSGKAAAMRLAAMRLCRSLLSVPFTRRVQRLSYASSTTTGTWSEAPLPLRSLRSICAAATLCAKAGLAHAKSIRMPSFFGKRRR